MSNNSTKIGVVTATIVGMNAMIGSGIFTAPAAMASNVGPAGILAYMLVVFSVWFIAQSLARLAYLFPQEGSFYTYTKQWGGHKAGLIASGAYLIGVLIAMGLLSQMAGLYLHHSIPSISSYWLGLGVLILFVLLNMFGIVLSEVGQHILIICTVFPLLATTIMCFSKANMSNLIPFMPYGITNILKATRIVIFGFFGFECAASLFNIVYNPQRNVPRALTSAIILVGIIYTLFIASIILSTPLHVFASPSVLVSDILAQLFPHNTWIITTIHLSILSAILGTIHSMIWSSSNLFVQILAKLTSPWGHRIATSFLGTQKGALLLVGFCISLSYISISNQDLFFYFTALGIVFAYILSMITLLTIKDEWISGQNIKTMIGIITASVILFFSAEGLVHSIQQAL